ncbi:ABC transporter permease [Paenibacillus sp. N1-5-1-14]|uniref:ABC transporter permease n=1 Tax=Paenibacillus radicibacter TaxID=2972488 RepID=UPI0021598D52|nr:ABC transporter permease [Paenibacillus radicibacter]MCR8645477.1 ABC transporter permease [Paenibacillus radicibacter]
MNLIHIALREVRLGFRNPWSYSFLILFTVFSMSLLLIQSQNFTAGYSSTTSTMLNFILYLLPLMTLLIGSFSLTAEKEEGSWQLLSTYPLSTLSFLLGKYIGLAIVLLTIIAFGYGVTSLVGLFTGKGLNYQTMGLFIVFSGGLIVLFLAVALCIGTWARNRWQALTFGVAIWFFFIIGWPTLLIAVLGMLPYLWIKPLLTILTLCNPAELVRLFVVVKLGGGTALGPEYYEWMQWINGPLGSLSFLTICLIWIGLAIGLAYWVWERGRCRG